VGLSAASTKVHREVKKFIDDYNYIIIDCPPAADSPVPQSALLIADLALVPLIPSPLDMWAAVGIRQVIHNVGDLNDALQSRLILNQCQPKTTLMQESLEILPEFGIGLARTLLQHRQIYRQSAVFGQSVHNFGNKAQAAIAEIESLTDEVLEILTIKQGNQ
jgi:chromosome partitioning protein